VKLVAGDTMNYWIKDHRPALLKFSRAWMFCSLTTLEARMLAGNNNLVQACARVMALGPRAVGRQARGVRRNIVLQLPSKIAERSFAPSKRQLSAQRSHRSHGAGDSFAGGFFG